MHYCYDSVRLSPQEKTSNCFCLFETFFSLYLGKFVALMNIYAKGLVSNESPMLCDMSKMNFSNLKKVIG